MNRHPRRYPHERSDGFGARRLALDPQRGLVEILELAPAFSGAAAEQALRSRAARAADLPAGVVVPVHRIDRARESLSIVSAAIDGVLLSDVLAVMQGSTAILSDGVVFELAASVIRVVTTLHELPGGFAHGAITPAHIALLPDGQVLLTDASFATALQDLQHNREQHWKEFGLTLPPAATLPRFDQRTDVSQLGAAVLAILLRRPLKADEYPRRILDLALDATASPAPYASAMRMWIQQALQLHPRSVFVSAAEAGRAFTEMTEHVGGRRTAAQALQRLLREMSGAADDGGIAQPVAVVGRPPLDGKSLHAFPGARAN